MPESMVSASSMANQRMRITQSPALTWCPEFTFGAAPTYVSMGFEFRRESTEGRLQRNAKQLWGNQGMGRSQCPVR